MEKCNPHIRNRIEQLGFTQWKVAEQLGISHVTLNVWLRTPLTDEREERILNAIDALNSELQKA